MRTHAELGPGDSWRAPMHILLLNQYYPPDTSATARIAAQVAETLAQRHKVTVVAGRPSYDPEEFYPFALLRREIRNNVMVERVGSTAYSRRQMAGRISNYLSYLALAIPRALTMKCDLVLAMTDPPIAGIAGAWISRLSARPFVYNIRDLYPDMAVAGGIVRERKWTAYWEKMHRRALRQAARVIVLGDDMRHRILAKGIPADRVAVVRDGASPSPPLPSIDNALVRELRCGFPFVAVHAGNLGFYGAWEVLLKAAEILRDENTGMVFVGDGANRPRLEALAAGSPNVRFLPFRPVNEISHVMAAGDVHIITVRRGLEGVVVPSKLYSILAAGRPVLAVAAAQTDVARIVTEEACGVAVNPDDPLEVATAICNLRNDPARLAEMGRRAREISTRYVRVNELNLFPLILEELEQDRDAGAPSGLL